MTIVDRIRNLSDVPISRLEKELEFSNGTISNWAKRNNPSATALYAVAKRLNVSMEYLLTGEVCSNEKNFVNSPVIKDNDNSNIAIGNNNVIGDNNSANKQIMADYESLSDEAKKKVNIFIRDLKDNFPTFSVERLTEYQEKFHQLILGSPMFWNLSCILRAATEPEMLALFTELSQTLANRGVIVEDYYKR